VVAGTQHGLDELGRRNSSVRLNVGCGFHRASVFQDPCLLTPAGDRRKRRDPVESGRERRDRRRANYKRVVRKFKFIRQMTPGIISPADAEIIPGVISPASFHGEEIELPLAHGPIEDGTA